MADTVSKQNNENFRRQAQLHRETADHARQMLSHGQNLYNTMVEVLRGSSLKDVHPQHWWETLQDHVINHITLHEQMADHLEKTVAEFDQTDRTIGTDFSS